MKLKCNSKTIYENLILFDKYFKYNTNKTIIAVWKEFKK